MEIYCKCKEDKRSAYILQDEYESAEMCRTCGLEIRDDLADNPYCICVTPIYEEEDREWYCAECMKAIDPTEIEDKADWVNELQAESYMEEKLGVDKL